MAPDERLRGFVASWLFAPYSGSADLDLFKRLLYCEVDFELVQVRRERPDLRLLDKPSVASFRRHEVAVPSGPRTAPARQAFLRGVHQTFDALQRPPHFLLSHSNEVPSHQAVLELKRRHPELPWVAYFGDVVGRNPYVRHFAEYPLFAEDAEIERETLALADVVICNNEHQRALMLEGVPEAASRTVVVPHCFVAAWYPPPPPRDDSRFTFMHLGTLYPVKRRALPVLRAVDLLCKVYPHVKDTFRVVFVGDDVPDADLGAWRALRHKNLVEFWPGVPYLDSLSLMQLADVLVVIDGLFDELPRSPYLPGKITDFLGAARPLLALTMRQGPTADVLRARGEPLCDDDPERVAFVMKRHLDGRVFSDASTSAWYRAELVGAAMETCFRAAIVGPEGVARLPALLRRLFDGVRSATGGASR